MRFTLLTFGLLIAFQASAGVYKCIDPSGNKIYSASPCPDGQSRMELNVKSGSSKDLKALEQQEQLTKQEEENKAAQKKQEEDAAVKKQEEFKRSAVEESAKNQVLIKNNPQQYSAYAIPPYKPDALPTFVKPFENRLPEIERFRREAAEKALATGECGRVEAVELNQKSKEGALVILVDCSTAKKFYVTEQELGSPPAAAPEVTATPAAEPAADAAQANEPAPATPDTTPAPAPASNATP